MKVKVPKLRRSQELLDAIMAKKAKKARTAIGCEQVLVEESDKESADNSDEEEDSSDKEHDDASWNKREVVSFINLLQEALKKEILSNVESKLEQAQKLVEQKDAGYYLQKLEAENIQLSEKKKDLEGQNEKLADALRERDSELKDMQDKLAEEMQNSADLRHKIKNKDKEIQKLRQERVVKKTPRKNRAANPPYTLLPSDIIEDYDFNENPISKATRKAKPTTSCKSVASAEDVERKTSAMLRVDLVSLIFEQDHSDDDDEPALSRTKNVTKMGDMLRTSPVCQDAAISPSLSLPLVTQRSLKLIMNSTRRHGKHADDTRLPLETTPNEDAIGAVGRGGQTLNVGPITRSKTLPRKKKDVPPPDGQPPSSVRVHVNQAPPFHAQPATVVTHTTVTTQSQESSMRQAIPELPMALAVILCIVNFVFPGFSKFSYSSSKRSDSDLCLRLLPNTSDSI
ncbi:unnamed protein product [Clavelina lepadiformis]|uniref:Uncharacterized protein n=1 Tax=Clavelina lepadiformis TaxID=159417 RepID=A0ABP0G946_CLALP